MIVEAKLKKKDCKTFATNNEKHNTFNALLWTIEANI